MARFSVTKLEAALAQTETAIDLWFHEGDPISIHTLTAAAHGVVFDLLEREGKTTMSFGTSYIKPGFEKEFKRVMRKAEAFFKRAKDDPDEVLPFNPESSEVYLFTTVCAYKELTQSRATPVLELFSAYFCLRHPNLMIKPLLPEPEKFPYLKKLLAAPRHEFFYEFLPLFASASARRLPR